MIEFDISHIRTAAEATAESISNISESQKTAASALAKITRQRPYVNVDALTSSEIAELERAIGEGSPEMTGKRVSSDLTLTGMYNGMESLGLVANINGMNGRPELVLVSALGMWAVEKRRQRDEEAQEDRERQWKHDRTMTWIAAIAGLVGAVIGAVLTVALTYWLLP